MKALKCRGGKLARVFCYLLLLSSLLVFSSMSFSWSSNFEQASAFSINVDPLSQKEFLENINTGYLASSYNSSNYISILGRRIEVVDTETTNVTPVSKIGRYIGYGYPGKFYFGHNTSYLFGGLANMSVGDNFSITIAGYKHNYRVMHIEVVEKISIMNGEMIDIAGARWKGRNYSVSLMTCAGQSYGNGDASHRTLVFANEI